MAENIYLNVSEGNISLREAQYHLPVRANITRPKDEYHSSMSATSEI